MTAITNLPDLHPSLVLDFANSRGVDPRVKFSRASTATYFDEFGVMQTAPAGVPRIDYDPTTGKCRGLLVEEQRTNLLKYSEQFDNAAWTKGNSRVTANASTAPVGTVTAYKLAENAAASRAHTFTQIQTFVAGTAYTISVFVKAAERSKVILGIDDTVAPGFQYGLFDLVSGTVSSYLGSPTCSITDIGNGWYRCSTTATAVSNYTGLGFSLQLHNGTSNVYTGDGTSGLYIWGAQLEEGSFPTSYIPSSVTFTGRASAGTYFGSDGLIKTAASGEARYQYNPLNLKLAPKLLLEEQRTNLNTYSEQFDNAVWAKVSSTISANATAAPDGTLTADKLVETTSPSTTHGVSQSVSVTSGSFYTISVFVKASERTAIALQFGSPGFGVNVTASFNLVAMTAIVAVSGTSTSVDITPIQGGWVRCSLTSQATYSTATGYVIYLENPANTRIYTGDGTSGLYIWGAQLEAGSYSTSYIKTEATQVTRVADSSTSAQTTRSGDLASMTGASFSDWYRQDEGTLLADFAVGGDVVNSMVTCLQVQGGNATLDVIRLRINSASTLDGAILSDGIVKSSNFVLPVTANTINKSAVTFKVGSSRAAMNGVLSATPGTPTTLPTVSSLGVGIGIPTGESLNGHIRRIAYYPRRITNEQLQALTTI